MRDPNDVTIFTVDKANSALPLVKRIVEDLVLEYPRWKDLVSRYELLAGGATSESGESPEMIGLRRDIDRLAARVNGYVSELEQVGVTLKGFEEGLVDFYGIHDDRMVCLCWRRGEDAVTHWHEMDAGFAGRQPIDAAFLAAEGAPAGARKN